MKKLILGTFVLCSCTVAPPQDPLLIATAIAHNRVATCLDESTKFEDVKPCLEKADKDSK